MSSGDQRTLNQAYSAALYRIGMGASELDEGQQVVVDPEKEILQAQDDLYRLVMRYKRFRGDVSDRDALRIVDQAAARLVRASRQLKRDAGT